jgi:threonine synthase
MNGAQATGCSPVATAFEAGTLDVVPQVPDTIARSLAIGNPADGYYALKVASETGGLIGHVSDDEVVGASGSWRRPRGSSPRPQVGSRSPTSLGSPSEGRFGRGERVVAVISGNGYKTLDAVEPTSDRPSRSARRSTTSRQLAARSA